MRTPFNSCLATFWLRRCVGIPISPRTETKKKNWTYLVEEKSNLKKMQHQKKPPNKIKTPNDEKENQTNAKRKEQHEAKEPTSSFDYILFFVFHTICFFMFVCPSYCCCYGVLCFEFASISFICNIISVTTAFE